MLLLWFLLFLLFGGVVLIGDFLFFGKGVGCYQMTVLDTVIISYFMYCLVSCLNRISLSCLHIISYS